MTSEKQIKANQINSLKSTGPKSEEGKSIVSKNAVKHGLLSSETILPWEDSKDAQGLHERFTTALQPVGELETILTDRIISLTWRLRRAGRIETAILAWRQYSEFYDRAKAEYDSTVTYKKAFDVSFPDEKIVEDEEKHKIATEVLFEKSRLVNSELPVLGRIFTKCADSMSTLHRYETGIEKSLYKALHELQRLQGARNGKDIPIPIAIDIHGDGEKSIS